MIIALFRHWAPKLFDYYDQTLGQLLENDHSLKKPFENSVYPAATYNLGPQTVCKPHQDFANLPFGFCAITALGNFDHKKGGHLVLEEYKLIVEFPAGYTVLIPSAIVTHSNKKIAEEERRFSFTQYAAGGLFRWVENGFRTTSAVEKTADQDEKAAMEEANQQRWKRGLSLFPKLFEWVPL